MLKHLLIFLCFLSVSVFAGSFTVTETFSAGPWYYSGGGERVDCSLPNGYKYFSSGCDIVVTSCDVSSSRNITLNRYEMYSSYGHVYVYLKLPFRGDNHDSEMKCTITITWTITCSHENSCPMGCGVCMTCNPDHVGPCEGCGQQIYGCEQHQCPGDCGHDKPCPKCGKVCMTCNPSHVGPCEDCQQPVYGCETNHKCHEGEFGHPLQKCPNCDVCLNCDPSHGSTCEHCDQYFYACENHNSVQEECSVCHAVYWSCVGHDVANLCPTCHGSNFCGVNGCKVCMDCNPEHIHEDSNACPVCHGTNFCPYCKICLNCNAHMVVCDTCKKAYFACRDHDCEGGTDGVCPVCLKKNFCSKCGLCINCNPNHCGTTGNTCNHNDLCKKCGKVCMTCNPSHTCGDGGGGDCGHNDLCKRCNKVCMTCNPQHVCVNKPPSGCGHNNLCPKCGKVCMTCNPQHTCGSGGGGGDGDDPEEEEKEYPELDIPESPEFVLPSSEALTLLLEKLSPPSFSSGSSTPDGPVVSGGVNYPKWDFTISGKDFGFDDFEIPFTIDCGKFAEEPLSLIPSFTKAASVVLFAYIFIMAVIRSLRQW